MRTLSMSHSGNRFQLVMRCPRWDNQTETEPGVTACLTLMTLNDDENDDNYSKNSEIEKMEEVVASTRSRADSHISDISVDALLEAHESPRHRRKMTEPDLGQNDLWDMDVAAQDACRQGHFMEPRPVWSF